MDGRAISRMETRRRGGFRPFKGQTSTFPELQEPPGYFLKEVKQDKQMNFHELAAYIRELQQSGFDTIRLQVQFHKKFAVPLFAVIMALISVPFAFIAANRGATAGIACQLRYRDRILGGQPGF